MKQLVLDAGPLIALFYGKDRDHAICVSGFQQLSRSNTVLLTPIPIMYEVYKWLLQRLGAKQAQQILTTLQASLQPISLSETDFLQVQAIVQSLPGWAGTLEDATVVFTANRYNCPVWTLNYRDLGTFKTLTFWTPNS